ncbi:hypothetical protein [Pelobium manganitolerans]|nr:hypothetical protein [Pelobium manganitolerans]
MQKNHAFITNKNALKIYQLNNMPLKNRRQNLVMPPNQLSKINKNYRPKP